MGRCVTPTKCNVSATIEKVTLELISQGFNRSILTFHAAHSQAFGTAVQDYVASHQNSSGLMLLGSFLKRSYRKSPYPVPTLTMGGELDGVCRVSRIMEEYVHHIQMAGNHSEAIHAEVPGDSNPGHESLAVCVWDTF